ncbi:MAG: hypothetical protein ACW99G_24165 [Candidatus Thorarchaeota archaeon]|jgi:hypothetical protein
MNKETLRKYYEDIKIERNIRMQNPDTPQNQRRIQSCNVQLYHIKNRIREMEQ